MKGSGALAARWIVTSAAWVIEAPLALSEVYRVHAPAVARWAGRLGGPRVEPEDVVHDVFLVVERRLPEFRGEARLATWIYRITARVVQRHLRRARLRALFGGDDEAERVASPSPTPLEHAELRDDVRRLYRALDRLGEKYRTTIILHDLEGLGAARVAELTGVEPATVWVRLHRGRKQLEKLLGGAR